MANQISQLRPPRHSPRRPVAVSPRRLTNPAFTLVELLVVIAVMIILIAIMLPAIKSLSRNNSQKQAVNLLTSLIANARSLAIQSRTPCGLVVYEDPALKGQTSAQLVKMSSETDLKYFKAAPRTGPQPLPRGIKVGTLDDHSTYIFRSEASTTADVMCRIILFDSNGQMVLYSRLARDPSLTDTSTAAWNLNATTSNTSAGVSSPGLVVYSSADLKAAQDNGTVTAADKASEWLKQNADILVVNPYTGNVIR